MIEINYDDALKLATKLHKGQLRKYSGDEYITHPIAVANRFHDESHKIVAILHDVIEDTDFTIECLKEYGFNNEIVKSIDILTKKENQDYLDYILLVKSDKIARRVKIEDLKHNLSDLKDGCLKAKYNISLYILKDGKM